MSKRLEKLVEEIMIRQAGNIPILLGYLEHQLDLLSALVKDLSEIVDQTKITPEIQERLNHLNQILAQSSINFDNLSHPMESYKLPGVVDKKRILRNIQARYLDAKLRNPEEE